VLLELAEPFERMTPAAASVLLLEHYGLRSTRLELLDTERDDSFKVITAAGLYVLKVAHPSDDPAVIEMQGAAMERAAAAGLPVQRVIAPVRELPKGRTVRLLTWLEGDLLAHTPPDLRSCGRMLGQLAAALTGFEHPAAHRHFAWDLQVFTELRAAPHPAVADLVFERFAALDLDALPHQFIHNDFHPGNVLVTEGTVVGILDFGDSLHSARVIDVAVALAYLLPDTGDALQQVDPFVDGYESVTPLLAAERDAIPTLVAARLVQRIVLNSLLPDPDRDAIERSTRILEKLVKEI